MQGQRDGALMVGPSSFGVGALPMLSHRCYICLMFKQMVTAAAMITLGAGGLWGAASAGLVDLPTAAATPPAASSAPSTLPTIAMTPVGTCGPQQATQAPQTAPVAAPAPQASTAGLLNINTATVAELDALPAVAITAEVAQRVVDYRTAHPFTSVAQLDEVKGIGAKTMERVTPLVTV